MRVIDRESEGLGEFEHIEALAVWHDGHVAVSDGEHCAIQVFSPDGQLERFVSIAREAKPRSSPLGHDEVLCAMASEL